jgi:hypothetical protein
MSFVTAGRGFERKSGCKEAPPYQGLPAYFVHFLADAIRAIAENSGYFACPWPIAR